MDEKLSLSKKCKIEQYTDTTEPVVIYYNGVRIVSLSSLADPNDSDDCIDTSNNAGSTTFSASDKCNTFGSGTDESGTTKDDLHLLNIFPNEIWCMVLKNVTGESDQEHLSNSSQFFRRMLLPMRQCFLFAKVAKPLLMYFINNADDDESSVEDNADIPQGSCGDENNSDSSAEDDDISEKSSESDGRCDSCLRKRKNRWFSEFLKLRLICQHWNIEIDKIFQNHPGHFQTKFEKPEALECFKWTELSSEYLDELATTEDFLDHFEETHGNDVGNTRSPFLGRELFINLQNVLEEHYEGLFNVLSKYGKHIWYLTLQCHDDFPTRASCYSKIHQVLTLLPSLKVLDFQFFNWVNHVNYGQESVELSIEIKLNPMPVIPALSRLKISNLQNQIIFQELIRSNGHVAMFDLVQRNITKGNCLDIFSVQMPNLKYIYLKCLKGDFKKLQHVYWKLEKLHLEFGEGTLVKWNKIIELAQNKWTQTLTKLVVSIPTAAVFEDKNTIRQTMYDQKDVEVYRNFQKLNASNIFKIFPKLQGFSFFGPDSKEVGFLRKY